MRRLLVVAAAAMLAAVFAACGDDGGRHTPDAPADSRADAPIDSPAGSAAAFAQLDPSPPDHKLELGVLVLSFVVVIGPVTLRRRIA